MKRNAKIMLFSITCFAFISCDRITKDIAKSQLKDKDPITYLHDWLRLEYVENTGVGMSLGKDLT